MTGFLICRVGELAAAVPLGDIIGVTEPAPVTPLPFSPPGIDGLVLAMGYSIIQMRLAERLGVAAVEKGVIIVAKVDDDVRALKVDAIESLVEIDADTIVPEDDHSDIGCIAGRCGLNDREIVVLDMRRLWGAGDTDLPHGGDQDAAALVARKPIAATDPAPTFQEPFLLVEIGGEYYAVRAEEVVEIVVVSTVRPMPGAPQWLAGLVDRRGMPILAVRTSRLLGHERRREDPLALALVVEHDEAAVVALMIDRALGIHYFSPGAQHAINDRTAGIESYLVADHGRIVGLIDVSGLLAQITDAIVAFRPAARREAFVPSSAIPSVVDRVLTVRLGRDYYAVALERVERIQASVTLTHLPGDGNGFDGMTDVGDATIPVLDLRKPRSDEPAPCVLVRLEGATAGVIVDQVLQISTVPRDRIEPIEPNERLPISGVCTLNETLVSILVIDRLLPLLPI